MGEVQPLKSRELRVLKKSSQTTHLQLFFVLLEEILRKQGD
ncbi:MAG: hypothetical protein ACM3SR_06160 [Ignavibacteriales bacterium]